MTMIVITQDIEVTKVVTDDEISCFAKQLNHADAQEPATMQRPSPEQLQEVSSMSMVCFQIIVLRLSLILSILFN